MQPQKISTCLWFAGQAEDAARFYVSLFPGSAIDRVVPGPGGEALVVEFHLAGTKFLALNGGPEFSLTEAISLSVACSDQSEIDELWKQLTAGGTESRCGWLKDRYGLSWQIVPSVLSRFLSNPERANAVMQTLLSMRKLDVATLQAAYDAVG